MQSKRCPGCKVVKAVSEFARDESKGDGLKSRCRDCDNARSRAQYARTREARLAARLDHYHASRKQAIAIYGGRCQQCGSTDRLEFDHVDWDGGEHRRAETANSMLFRIARTGQQIADRRLQLLCHDCHKSRRRPVRQAS